MLHRVNPPQYTPLLMRVVEFEKNLLRWVCTPPVTFTLDGVKAAFGNDDQAEWLWERIERGEKKTSFGKAVQNAIQHVQQHPAVGQWILQCAQNDLDFYQHFTDSQFSFVERRLPSGAITANDLSVFNPMLVGLYETIFGGSGFPVAIHQGSVVDNLTRAHWNENFWATNTSLGVCPVCDGKKPDLVHRSRASDLDHFFPKEKYPLLSIHPYNLIPICSTCNSRAKGIKDPLNEHTAETLLDTFYPYCCPAIDHIDLHISKSIGKGIKIAIQEHNGASSKRTNNLVRVFDLETRWADWYENYIGNRIEIMCSRLFTTQDQVHEYLQNDLIDSSILQAKQENCFVYAKFLQHLLNDPQEFEDLCASIGLK